MKVLEKRQTISFVLIVLCTFIIINEAKQFK